MTQVVFRGKRSDLMSAVRQLGAVLAGRQSDPDQLARGFFSALGFAALSDIKDAYITKADGGTDEMGIKWPPLKPATIAARRVGPRDLEQAAIRTRETIRKRETSRALRRFQLSGLSDGEARRRAAIVGGLAATRQTGRTKVQTLGNRQVEILRDRGLLFNSLSPGEFTGTDYQKPTGEGGENQIFEMRPGEIVVGTNDVKASTHQHGRGNIPARPFLPSDEYPVPDVWWSRWLGVAIGALVNVVAAQVRRGR